MMRGLFKILQPAMALFALLFVYCGGLDNGDSPPVWQPGAICQKESSRIYIQSPEEWGSGFDIEELPDGGIAVYHAATRAVLPEGGYLFSVRRFDHEPVDRPGLRYTSSYGCIFEDGSAVYYTAHQPYDEELEAQYIPGTKQGEEYLLWSSLVSQLLIDNLPCDSHFPQG